MKYDFKPFQKVLVMDVSAGDGWRASIFSHCRHGHFVTINGWEFDRMIPFEGNEHLLGTTDDPEPELKDGDAVMVWDEGFDSRFVKVYSHYDRELHQHMVHHEVLCDGKTERKNGWDHAKKFVPASVEG